MKGNTVSQESAVNLNSLALIREELDATILRAAAGFETWLQDTHNRDAIGDCAADIAQVAGTLRLIQFDAGALLADEMTATVRAIADAAGQGGGADPATEALAGTLGHAFFLLPRFVEFVADRRSVPPMLIVDYVNELRVARRQPLVPEYHFEQRSLPLVPRQPLPDSGAAPNRAMLERLRQMYQVGLLALLRQQNPESNLQLLARASARFADQLPGASGDGFWHLAAAAIECLAQGALALNLNRRRTLGLVERAMARYLKGGEAALAQAMDTGVRRELVHLLALSAHRRERAGRVIDAFGIPALKPDDRELAALREGLRGPGLEAIDSVVRVLKEELRNAKDILEIAAQNQGIAAEELTPLRDTLTRVADTLKVVNLRAPGEVLREQLFFIDGWADHKNGVPPEQFLAVADAVLFIESSLAGLYRHEIRVADLERITDAARKQIVADNQFAEAARIVIEEAQAAVALAKRAITAYVESDYDPIHIANVAVTLNTVRGGMHILEHDRAGVIVAGCIAFIDGHSREMPQGAARQPLLETLADALISLEYYLGELAAQRTPDRKILDVAEQSLTALGFAIPSQTSPR